MHRRHQWRYRGLRHQQRRHRRGDGSCRSDASAFWHSSSPSWPGGYKPHTFVPAIDQLARDMAAGGGPVRIVVVGTSGAGKTTLARRIASHLGLPHIELDAINWQSGWHDLTRHDPQEFVRRVTEAIRVEAWVVDGNYGPVRDSVWQHATHLVWLDYERPVIMARVISRTF